MATEPTPESAPPARNTGRGCAAPLAVLAAALALGAVGGGLAHRGRVPVAAVTGPTAAVAPVAPDPADTALAEEPAPEPAPGDLVGPLSRWAWNAVEPSAPVPGEETAPATAEPPRTAMVVPLPVPRPPEFRGPGGSSFVRRADRSASRRQTAAALPPQPQEDDRSFLEKLFGVERPPALAYAALESRPADIAPRRAAPARLSPPLGPSADVSPTGGTAVYNIAARVVTLPSGERLEAHSGLAESFDDPRFVNVRMRGPTPPGTYDLTEREQLFHGVRAIRLTPVGGSEAVYGRVGLLAHTFMLGARGDSNGCVSFRDYDRFLQAYLRGEIQRLVVVSGTQDPLPALADRGAVRVARAGD